MTLRVALINEMYLQRGLTPELFSCPALLVQPVQLMHPQYFVLGVSDEFCSVSVRSSSGTLVGTLKSLLP